MYVCICMYVYMYPCTYVCSGNWASEASPTLGCSIEISGDIYMSVGMSVIVICQINCVGGITWTIHEHAQSQVLGC